MATSQDSTAIPLVLPNNCEWNPDSREYKIKTNVKRETLKVVPKALDLLREIKGPVCVVSIAGTYRGGKSYILSKLFDQGEVFPLGHSLDAETMGIWLWVVPKKFKDSKGNEFTVVLLDSEGINAPFSNRSDDYRVFTLSVLLSSILIYNSNGAPKEGDLEKLQCVKNLSEQIQRCSNSTTNADRLHEVMPHFIWLIRDLVLKLPKDCSTIKDFFEKRIFNAKTSGFSESAKEAADSILKYFSGFDAFDLPPPSCDSEVIADLYANEAKANKKFFERIEQFKGMFHPLMKPKRSISEREFITGEALAALVQLFVQALNTPGTVPNVQDVWNTFVHSKCTETCNATLETYKEEMFKVKGTFPCDADVLRQAHKTATKLCFEQFRRETSSFSIASIDKYLEELTVKCSDELFIKMEKNNRATESCCEKLMGSLKTTFLDPVFARLDGADGDDGFNSKYKDVVKACNEVEKKYKSQAKGAKEIQDKIFVDFFQKFTNEMQQKQKDYDEALKRKEQTRIAVETATRKLEEENARLANEARIKAKKMEQKQRDYDEALRKKELEKIAVENATRKAEEENARLANEARIKANEMELRRIVHEMASRKVKEENARLANEARIKDDEIALLKEKHKKDLEKMQQIENDKRKEQEKQLAAMRNSESPKLEEERQGLIKKQTTWEYNVETEKQTIETREEEADELRRQREEVNTKKYFLDIVSGIIEGLNLAKDLARTILYFFKK